MYFDNIIGQDFAKKYLTNSIKKNKMNHAYMFEGMDGVGKKKLSVELSKILLDTENSHMIFLSILYHVHECLFSFHL